MPMPMHMLSWPTLCSPAQASPAKAPCVHLQPAAVSSSCTLPLQQQETSSTTSFPRPVSVTSDIQPDLTGLPASLPPTS